MTDVILILTAAIILLVGLLAVNLWFFHHKPKTVLGWIIYIVLTFLLIFSIGTSVNSYISSHLQEPSDQIMTLGDILWTSISVTGTGLIGLFIAGKIADNRIDHNK